MATIVDAHVEGTSLGQTAPGDMTAEARPVYKKIELVGSSSNGIEDAVNNAFSRAGKTIRNMKWFEVAELRGHLENNKVADWQVTVKIGFTLDT
jgi:dodecin